MEKLISIFILSYILNFSHISAQPSWQVIELPASFGSTYHFSFLNASTGYLLSNGLYKTTNEGVNWFLASSASIPSQYDVVKFITPDIGWVISQATLFKTINSGANWTILPDTLGPIASISFLNSATGWICDGQKFRTTTNGGLNFSVRSIDSGGLVFGCNRIEFINENTGYIMGRLGIKKTSNGGANWSSVRRSDSVRVWYGDFINENTGIVVGEKNSGDKNLGRTTNGGINWNYFSLGNSLLYFVSFINNQTGWACGSLGSLYKTTDAGLTWVKYNNIDPNYSLYHIDFVNEITGYIATRTNAILKTTNGGLVFIEQIYNSAPDKFSLSQNYPNPFNPNSIINFQIPKNNFVSLKVFDINGREVTDLVNENLSAGEYKINFDGSALPSGVYYYKLTSDNFSETKKMILIK